MVIFTKRLLFALSLLFCNAGYCQVIHSLSSGFWDDPAVWENGIVPTSSNSTEIIVSSGHSIRVRQDHSIDNLTVATGATLKIEGGTTFHLVNGAGVDLLCQG